MSVSFGRFIQILASAIFNFGIDKAVNVFVEYTVTADFSE